MQVKSLAFFAVLFLSFQTISKAQFDDLYYDPSKNKTSTVETPIDESDGPVNSVQSGNAEVYGNGNYDNDVYDGEYYADDDYGYDDDYDDYSYSTRIKRFHRPVYGFSYYSPVFFDYYDPFYTSYDPYWYGGNSVYISVGNPFWYSGWGWNRYNSWNSWNNWGWNNWAYNGCGNSWYGNGWNNGWYGGGWNHGGHGNGWYGNHDNDGGSDNNHPYGTYYGSRKNSSTASSTKGRTEGPRLTSPRTPSTNEKYTHTMGEAGNEGSMGDSPRGEIRTTNKSSIKNQALVSDEDVKGNEASSRRSIYNRKDSNKDRSTYAPESLPQSTKSDSDQRRYRSSNNDTAPSRSERKASRDDNSSSRSNSPSYTPSRSSNSSGSRGSDARSNSSNRSAPSSSGRSGGSSRKGGGE